MATGQGGKSSRTKELSATDHQEIEWQFESGELEMVEGWLGQHNSGSSGLVVAPQPTVEITDTYYDTDDWRFYRAGYALRVRKTDVEATMKSLTPAEGSLRRRREISESLMDFVSEIYGKPVQKLVEPLKALQDELGDHQDAVVAAAYLRELGTKTGETRVPRGVAFTMGIYSERCAREAKDLHSVVPGSKPFRTLKKGKRWKKFEKVLESRNRSNLSNKRVR